MRPEPYRHDIKMKQAVKMREYVEGLTLKNTPNAAKLSTGQMH